MIFHNYESAKFPLTPKRGIAIQPLSELRIIFMVKCAFRPTDFVFRGKQKSKQAFMFESFRTANCENLAVKVPLLAIDGMPLDFMTASNGSINTLLIRNTYQRPVRLFLDLWGAVVEGTKPFRSLRFKEFPGQVPFTLQVDSA